MFDKTGILIDGNNFLYRTYHVLKHHTEGELTEGFIAYSFINQIRCLIPKLGTLNPMVYILWDGVGSRESRIKIYEDYKGNRPSSPSIITSTRTTMQEELGKICDRLNIQIYGVEADDLIYILAKEPSLQEQVKQWIICTCDEDLMQSLSDYIKYYNPHSKNIWTRESMIEKYGFSPRRLILFKALVGDTSDNWPGVAGIGKVTANNLLQNDLPLHKVMENIHAKLKVKDKAKTEERVDRFYQGLQLCELPLQSKDRPDWLNYLQEVVHAPVKQDWTHFHQTFQIEATGRAAFQIGQIDVQ